MRFKYLFLFFVLLVICFTGTALFYVSSISSEYETNINKQSTPTYNAAPTTQPKINTNKEVRNIAKELRGLNEESKINASEIKPILEKLEKELKNEQ